MKKYILHIFLFTILFLTNSIGAEIIRYQTENRSSLLDDKMAATIIRGATSNSLNFNTSTPICKDLYKFVYDENENIKSKTRVEAQKYLIDFNFKEGTFTCSYVNEKEFGDASKSIILSIPNWTLLLGYIDGTKSGSSLVNISSQIQIDDIYNLFDAEYKPSNISVIPDYGHYETTWETIKKLGKKIFTLGNNTDDTNSLITDSYNIGKRAKELGLNYLNENKDKENFTVSQFVTGLVTLNSNVVSGISETGDIIINPEVEKKMTILDSVEYTKGIWETFSDKVSKVYNDMTGGQVNNVNYTNVFSFEQYFDKKIFGLYYEFMSLGWQAVFDYAGLLILAMVFLYSGGVVGYKFFMFRINSNNEGKEWDFPFANRLTAIVIMLIVFFIHFPSGSSESVISNNNQSDKVFEITTSNNQNTQIDSQTTLFKIGMGFLANMGATIADATATNATVIYMKYLFSVTHTQSYEDTLKILKHNRREIVEQAVLQSFFKDNCIASHEVSYKKYNGFQVADSHVDFLWNVDTGSSKIFDNKGTISPLMCKNLEISLMIGREYLKRSKASTEKTIVNLSKNSNFNITTNNTSYTSMSKLYADTQLLGVKNIGWFMASTLPISHVFMLNSNIINNAYDGLSRTTNGEAVTTMLINKANDLYTKEDENLSKQTLDTEILNSVTSNWITNTFSTLISYQIYNMFPFFGEIRQFFEKAVEGAGESLFEVAGIFIPQTKLLSFAKSSLDKFTKESNEQKSKNNLKDSKDKESKRSQSIDFLSSGFKSFMIYVTSFSLAVIFYKLMIQGIFAAVITLLAILKIGLYFWDCFMHFFVSPFMVLWQMTIKEKTDRINSYFVDGFILYVIKPTLIVSSFFMFIISFEIITAVYSLIFDICFSTLNLSNSLYEDSSISLSFVTQSVITGFSDIFIYFIGMILAYFIILKGDDMILAKFKYKDETESGLLNQLGDRVQTLGGARI